MSEAAAVRRPARRYLGPLTAAESASARIAGMTPAFVIALFFVALMLPLGLVEVSRTGIAAISRGPNGM